MGIPIIIALPIGILGFFIWIVVHNIKDEYREWKKLEDELEKQAKESERPHIEPMYRKKYGKRKK